MQEQGREGEVKEACGWMRGQVEQLEDEFEECEVAVVQAQSCSLAMFSRLLRMVWRRRCQYR